MAAAGGGGGGGGGEVQERLRLAKAEAEALRNRLKEERARRTTEDLCELGKSDGMTFAFKIARRLTGHFGKVYAMHWASDSTRLVSASQDGKLMVWNAFSENKLHSINLKSPWVMTCAFEQGATAKLVAAGGLDNTCTVYDLSNPEASISTPFKELTGHDGYLSCCRFLDERQILTSSGDATCALWDIERGVSVKTFRDHVGDVMSIALNPTNPNVFVSGAVDQVARVWDIRAGKSTHSFTGHRSDINAIDFLHNGVSFATGSDDFTARIFDMRCLAEVSRFEGTEGEGGEGLTINGGITSVALSRSGRLLFAGYEDNRCIAWETIHRDRRFHILQHSTNPAENNRISCVGVSKDGRAMCTGSWDTMLAIWA